MTAVCAAVAYLVSALVVLVFPPKAGAPAEGTAPWWIAGGALFVTYVCISLLLRVSPSFCCCHGSYHVARMLRCQAIHQLTACGCTRTNLHSDQISKWLRVDLHSYMWD